MTPITETSLKDLLEEAQSSFEDVEELKTWHVRVTGATHARWNLAREVALAQDMVNAAEKRGDALPNHWKDAHGELVRVRRQLHEAEGEILNLRSELERRVRRVRLEATK